MRTCDTGELKSDQSECLTVEVQCHLLLSPWSDSLCVGQSATEASPPSHSLCVVDWNFHIYVSPSLSLRQPVFLPLFCSDTDHNDLSPFSSHYSIKTVTHSDCLTVFLRFYIFMSKTLKLKVGRKENFKKIIKFSLMVNPFLKRQWCYVVLP